MRLWKLKISQCALFPLCDMVGGGWGGEEEQGEKEGNSLFLYFWSTGHIWRYSGATLGFTLRNYYLARGEPETESGLAACKETP